MIRAEEFDRLADLPVDDPASVDKPTTARFWIALWRITETSVDSARCRRVQPIAFGTDSVPR